MKNYTDSLLELEEAFSASQYPIAVQKMQDFNSGIRKENIKACGDQKLVDYYDICVAKNLNNARAQIEVELQNRGLGSFIISSQPQQTAPQQPTQQAISYAYTENDFHTADAQFIKDNANDEALILANIFGNASLTQSEMIKLCIANIILAVAIGEHGIATMLKDTIAKVVSVAELKNIIGAIQTDANIIKRLNEIKALVNPINNNLNQSMNNNKFDITVNAQPGAAMYRLVTYNKDYNPPARQYLLIRSFDHNINKYKVGIEGSPRNTSDWAEPVFDSIQQAENFAKNAINLKTARNVANFKYSIVSKPFSGGTADLSDCTLVDTILGPAYIQNKSSYKESLNKEIVKEDIEKHDKLNPKLWNEDHTLKAEVKDKINNIVAEFLAGLDDKEIRYKLDDIKLVGSNCSYNYNKDSDLDLHIVFDLSIYDDAEKQEMAEIIYDYARGNWNKNHTITFYDIPVEIFVETNNTEQLN